MLRATATFSRLGRGSYLLRGDRNLSAIKVRPEPHECPQAMLSRCAKMRDRAHLRHFLPVCPYRTKQPVCSRRLPLLLGDRRYISPQTRNCLWRQRRREGKLGGEARRMTLPNVALDDKYDLSKGRIFATGYQALVRLCLMQKELDRRAGLNTAGYVSGYRGSPLGGLDQQFMRAKRWLDKADVVFQPGLNEDLAATALWGTQQAELRGEGRFDGVFGMWYGKGPGVDRCGDVFRHANFAGTSKHGGVLALMGDDHTAESSTTAHQSE